VDYLNNVSIPIIGASLKIIIIIIIIIIIDGARIADVLRKLTTYET